MGRQDWTKKSVKLVWQRLCLPSLLLELTQVVFEQVDLGQITWWSRSLNKVHQIGICVTIHNPRIGF